LCTGGEVGGKIIGLLDRILGQFESHLDQLSGKVTAICGTYCQPSVGSELNRVHDTKDSHARSIPTSVPSANSKSQIYCKCENNNNKHSVNGHESDGRHGFGNLYFKLVNPLTIVLRDGKAVDARKVNRYTSPDRARVSSIQELLQQFHGSKFNISTDLSSAFLQIGLKKESRKYTTFLFDSQLYQFTICQYGFRNCLPAFVRALQLTLGSDTYDYALAYVDDIVYSPTFELHLKHLDTVLIRLNRAGFTVNAGKCNFHKIEISFLGHVIRQGVVSPDPRRIEAILNYPAPRNQRQFRLFLGTANYHHRFVVNYADYVAPLLLLLKKRTKWHWSSESQKAFVKLREKFADRIHFVQSDETLTYTVNTDASGRAIGGVMMQT
jgi:hypothetical protein